MSYEGNDRRNYKQDHDLLTRIDVTVTAIGKNHEEFLTAFKSHLKDDVAGFDEVHKRVNDLSRYVFIGMGIVIALEFASYWILKKL